MRKTITFCAWSLGLLLLGASSACAQMSVQAPSSPLPAVETILPELSQADVVYLGETHDRPADHIAQLHMIRSLHQRQPKLAIAMEMFQRPFQGAVDRYLVGEISASELRQQSEYDERWGFAWEYYLPILEFAKANQLPVIALNTPTEITHRVAQSGLEQLTNADRQWIPPLSEIQIGSPEYRQMLQDSYTAHAGHGNSDSSENFVLAQVLWDETMADRIATFLQENPGYQIVVLAGQGHIVYDYGIPSRVQRRMAGMSEFQQRSILLNPSEETRASGINAAGDTIADYMWHTDE